MKQKVIYLFAMLCFAQTMMAQESKPYLVTEGKQWAVYHYKPECSAHRSGTITYRLQGDTILHGKTYKMRWMSRKEDLSDMQPCNTYMREENGKVYTADAYGEQLWFDYTAQVGDTICFKEGYEYGRIQEIHDALLSETDSTKSYRCYEVQLGKSNGEASDVAFANQYISVCEGLGVVGSFMGYGLSEHVYSSYGRCSFSLLCVHDNGEILYQTPRGCYVPIPEPSRPSNKRGYGYYYNDSYLHTYTINEAEGVKDSTDFARWNDKTVIYFDVDSVGENAFTNAIFRQGQILYFTERLKYIGPNAFSNIMMLDEEPEEKNPFGDLCIAFGGDTPPAIEEDCIVNYADTTYRITYVVPDLTTYIESDIQWIYSQLVTIDDFIKGYVSPENEIVVPDADGVGLDVDVENDGAVSNNCVTIYATARTRKDIPVRIGDGENKDIYGRAPAWMRYTIELKVTDTDGKVLYADSKQCSGYNECQFEANISVPANGIVLVHSRSIDQYGNASEWTVEEVRLNEEKGYKTDTHVDLSEIGEAEELTALVGKDSIRITGYYYSNCGGGLYCVANAEENTIVLTFYDDATANCMEYHHVDFTIPRMTTKVDRIYVVESYDQSVRLEVNIKYDSAVCDILMSDTNLPLYDLQGRKVTNPTRGIYIKKGRKIEIR